jgi:hypothetical protein
MRLLRVHALLVGVLALGRLREMVVLYPQERALLPEVVSLQLACQLLSSQILGMAAEM